MFNQQDHQYMARALKLARRGLYTTHPNPRVGCVIVKDDEILSEGWHQKTGGLHAEAHAIYQASADLNNSTAYITLEPCSHQGRTPPCTDALIQSGLSRVVVAVNDPNPRVNGSGLDKLRQANIKVEIGLMEDQARELNKGFFSLYEKFRPWVRLKTAASLDGRTAMASGESQWITSEPARLDGHKLRAQSAGVMTGINTVLADDPRLTARVDNCDRQPVRIILDSKLQTPIDARLFDSSGEILILTCENADTDSALLLKDKGASVIQLESDDGRLNLASVIDTLTAMSISELHVEAGRVLTGQFIKEGFADEIVAYLAPTILGDGARGMFEIPGLEKLSQQHKISWFDQRMIGNDLRLTLRVV